jgi:S-adenosylmethionine:tRNA ribosyltransferase-isomerase
VKASEATIQAHSTPKPAASSASPASPSEALADQRAAYDYTLPPGLIAQCPLPERSGSRLLLLDGARNGWRDLAMPALPQLLEPGDLLVLNDTRVLPARLAARKPTGGRLELLLERPLSGRRALVQLRDSRAVRSGLALQSAGGTIVLLARRGQFWEVELPEEPVPFFERYGQVPLPPYIERAPEEADRERYQSLWARVPGAVAAPTASLHFDATLLAALAARGVQRTFVTLHVGAGTFSPLRSERLDEHVMHAEHYAVSEEAVAAVSAARSAGRRVVAVGTTVARALESAALRAGESSGRALLIGSDETTLFIHPGFRFRVVDALLTNFHLPQSTLLMLVAAFAGRELVLSAYAHAVQERYRFFSYGDAMLVLPTADATERAA